MTLAVPVLVLVSAGLAYASARNGSKSVRHPSTHASSTANVYGGGRFGPGTFPNGLTFVDPRDFSVDAGMTAAGARGHVYYGRNASGFLLGVDVTCLDIQGNSAAIGGVVRESGDPADVGDGFVIFLVDNGSPSGPVRDRSSAGFIDPLSASEWPAGFPRVCPAADGPFNAPGYLDIHSGDVVVQH